jgi:hypothetical protein
VGRWGSVDVVVTTVSMEHLGLWLYTESGQALDQSRHDPAFPRYLAPFEAALTSAQVLHWTAESFSRLFLRLFLRLYLRLFVMSPSCWLAVHAPAGT